MCVYDGVAVRVAVVSKDGVPDFGPPMDNEALFKKGEDFKKFLYTKRTYDGGPTPPPLC